MIDSIWNAVKIVCEEGIEAATNKCLNPDTTEKDRLVANGEAMAYRHILGLQKSDDSGQFQGDH